jgi:ureidoglycolate dehydrogenase (NAD+)
MPIFASKSLHRFTQELLKARRMSSSDALTVANSLDWADCSGISSHGIAFLPRYLEFIAQGDLDPQARPEVISEPPGPWVIDAQRAAGAVAMRFAFDTALEALGNAPTVMLWIRRMTHAGAIGQYVESAVRGGAIAIAVTAGPPLMAYHGTARAAATTGPLVMGAPGPGGEPIVLDMATSDLSFGRLRQAKRSGKALPAGTALDAAGMPTTDPAQATTPLPLSGPKGAGMALMFELMASVLAGNPITEPFLSASERPRHSQNAMLMLARTDSFSELNGGYGAQVSALVSTLKAMPRAQGTDEILLPGERRARSRRKTGERGTIEVSDMVWQELRTHAVAAGVELPPTL